MKTLWGVALVGLSLVVVSDPVFAQRDGRDYGSDQRENGDRSFSEREYGGRSRGYDDDNEERPRDRGRRSDEDQDRQRSRGYDDDGRERQRDRRPSEGREADFDEGEYLRCNPDVRRAVEHGEMASGAVHYRTFGRREGRRLTCATKL
ncbi:hypothetical protein [Methylobacterium sp. V23]|uniref:hypothetical protein n=1 Tax=Methylobacterium sp. V23 TaxID=2044878 RepID=UPI000CDAA7E5|nr:hypothetical protein [Methylobacterium sp. V23]POR40383.1 hypothetical protein CRT23_23945 [Methylobacterium sp. V23]